MTTTAASVSVNVDPFTAFTAFTEEMDLWWVRGPINYYDAARAVGMRCEPGVGGRIIEVYDEATGEGLELARLTAWEPGSRLAWRSTRDDVAIEVRFVPVPGGTDVTVEATIPDEGVDRGGTAWVRVVPRWFGAWCARRETAARLQPELARLAVGLYYAKPAEAARWLSSVFGFESPSALPEAPDPLSEGEYGHPWIEFRIGNCLLMVFKREGDFSDQAAQIHETWVFVDDLEAHLARGRARRSEDPPGHPSDRLSVLRGRGPLGLRPGASRPGLSGRCSGESAGSSRAPPIFGKDRACPRDLHRLAALEPHLTGVSERVTDEVESGHDEDDEDPGGIHLPPVTVVQVGDARGEVRPRSRL